MGFSKEEFLCDPILFCRFSEGKWTCGPSLAATTEQPKFLQEQKGQIKVTLEHEDQNLIKYIRKKEKLLLSLLLSHDRKFSNKLVLELQINLVETCR